MLGRIDIVTIFPELMEGLLSASLVGSARERGLVELEAHDLRAFATDRRRTVDDSPYGGGPAMKFCRVKSVEVRALIDSSEADEPTNVRVGTSPYGGA